MKVIVVGIGTIGSAVGKVLKEHGHEVVSVGRKSGDYQADISDMASLKKLFANIGRFDAVANAAGDVFPGPFEQLTDEQMGEVDRWERNGADQPCTSRSSSHRGQRVVHTHLRRLDR
jgi:NAD(P)-dependent dehydrogenase (short-subunit alcohol dehydrogenase family)